MDSEKSADPHSKWLLFAKTKARGVKLFAMVSNGEHERKEGAALLREK